MAGFRSQYEQRKWDSLKAQERTALTKVISGKGKPEDFKALESLVSKYDALAGNIMKRVLRSIEDSVNKQLNQQRTKRESTGERPLSEEETRIIMDDALDAAWRDQGPELVVIIEDSIGRLLKEQDNQNQAEFAKRLQDQLGPKQMFTIDDLVEYLTNPAVQKAKDRVWEERMEELHQRFDSVQDALYYLEDRVEKRAEVGALRAIRRYVSGESERQAHPLTGRSPKDILNGQLASNQVRDQDRTETMNAARNFEQIITEALQNQDTTLQEIRNSLNRLRTSDSDRRRRDAERADTYSRSLKKNGFGSRVKAAGLGLLAGLGILGAKLLLSEIMGGKVWQELTKFFSDGTIMDFSKRFLDLLSSAGKAVADYITSQFKDAAQARDDKAGVNPNDSPAVANAKRDVLASQARLDYLKGNFPEMVDSAQTELDSRKKNLQQLLEDAESDKKAGRGKVEVEPATSGASGTPPSSAGGTGTPDTGSGSAPSGGFPGSIPSGSALPNLATPTTSDSGSRPFPRAMSTSGDTSTSQSSSPPMSAPTVSDPPPPLAPIGSPRASTSQAVGGPIASIQDHQWRPGVDGSMNILNVGMLG